MKVVPVKAAQAAEWRDRLEWHFESFCGDGSLDPDDLWADVDSKFRQLWVVEDDGAVKAAVLTSVCDDNYQTCDVTHAAGEDRAAWQHLWDNLEVWATEIGCQRIRAFARSGWERILPLKRTHVVLERFLDGQ